MELRDYLRVLRNRWQIIALCAAIGIALGALFVLHSPKKYQSQSQLFVSTSAADTDPTAIFQGGQFTQARVQSYAEIVGGPLVAQRVADQIGGGLTAKIVEKEVTATAPTNTVLLNVTVTDESPKRAQQIAAGIGEVFPGIVSKVEAPDSAGQSPVKVSVVKPATFSASPVSPRPALDISLAVLAGLVLGLGAALLLDTLDSTIKSTEDVQATTGSTTIGVIAFDPDAKAHPLVVIDDLHGTRAEAFRQLRTNLQFVDIDAPLRSLVCTSSVPGEGKTTTICNLAITLAHTGMRVLLMEADLRRPRVGMYMGLDDAVGLTSVLIGAVDFHQAVQHWGPDGLLDVLPCGPKPPNPSELLGSRGMADLLRSAEQAYDIVLLDAPPLLPVTDAAVLSVETSGAIVIVHHGKTRREQLENSVQALSAVGARVLGTVINFAPRKGPEAYYYGYAYSYRSNDAQSSAPPPQPATARAGTPKQVFHPPGDDNVPNEANGALRPSDPASPPTASETGAAAPADRDARSSGQAAHTTLWRPSEDLGTLPAAPLTPFSGGRSEPGDRGWAGEEH